VGKWEEGGGGESGDDIYQSDGRTHTQPTHLSRGVRHAGTPGEEVEHVERVADLEVLIDVNIEAIGEGSGADLDPAGRHTQQPRHRLGDAGVVPRHNPAVPRARGGLDGGVAHRPPRDAAAKGAVGLATDVHGDAARNGEARGGAAGRVGDLHRRREVGPARVDARDGRLEAVERGGAGDGEDGREGDERVRRHDHWLK
jgi:hypothetical protein